jgi:cytoskeletal protein RodZ
MPYSVKKSKTVSTKNKKKNLKPALILLLVVALAVAGFWVMNRHTKPVSGPIPTTSVKSAASPDKKKPAGETTTPTSQDKSAGGDQTNPTSDIPLPSAPSGTFVSSHHVSLSNKSTRQEQSACNTIASATCYIEFSKDGVVKTLPKQVADSNGVVIWNWDVSDAGLDAGSWKITAIASSGGVTKSTTDTLSLEVAE